MKAGTSETSKKDDKTPTTKSEIAVEFEAKVEPFANTVAEFNPLIGKLQHEGTTELMVSKAVLEYFIADKSAKSFWYGSPSVHCILQGHKEEVLDQMAKRLP